VHVRMRMGRQGLEKLRRNMEDDAIGTNLLACVVDIRSDGDFLVHPRGRRHNALLSATMAFNAFQNYSLRFADVLVVDVARDAEGRERVTACRGASEQEFESR
jgi:hypothetical protein